MLKKKQKKKTALPWLPHEITLFHILSKLPVRCLLKFSCVSKLWYKTIHHDPNFISSHFTHAKSKPSLVVLASLNDNSISFGGHQYQYHHHPTNINNSVSHLVLLFESIYVVGSCNGLTCNRLKSSSAIQIINPCTRELLTFPQPKLSAETQSFCTETCLITTIKHGFGFDPLKNEYKVIQMCAKRGSDYYECWVYTLGGTTNLWRNITATCNYLPSYFPVNLAPICIRGVLFWWTCLTMMNDSKWILSFDLHHEKFQPIPCPPEEGGSICSNLIELEEGRPCLAYRNRVQRLYMLNDEDHHKHQHHLNVMHEDTSSCSTGSWIRLGYFIFLPKRPYLLRAVAINKQIYLQDGNSELYNVNREGIRYKLSDSLRCDDSPSSLKDILVNHVENLLSLKTFVPPPSAGEAEVRYVSSRDAIHGILTTTTRRDAIHGFLTTTTTTSTSCCDTDTEQQERDLQLERRRIRLLNHGCLPCWISR